MEQTRPNAFHNTFSIAEYFVVPKPKDLESSRFEKSCSRHVCFLLLCVMSAVDFQNQSLLEADEIDNVGTDDLLTPKFLSE